MGDAEQDKLLADGALAPPSSQHELALPSVGQHPLHLDAVRLLAAYAMAPCGMDQEPLALLDGGFPLLLGVRFEL